ncbi:putative quinol monooxygenase [Streptomyces sp. NPDC046805]|uniref:putative quinol monooxygenase n=1 Tax=Streptomyces sp. NPDC046805 TaxID=3155134 RepID=UPI0033DFAA03
MQNINGSWPLADTRSGQIVVIARWRPAAGNHDAIIATIDELITASRAEAGCLGYQAYPAEGGEIVLIERYADRDALEAHRNSEHFQRVALERIVPLLEDRQVVVTTID